jgi:hypothetical protein
LNGEHREARKAVDVRALQHLTHPAALGAFSLLLFASGAAVWAESVTLDWPGLLAGLSSCVLASGANIDHALLLAFVGGLAGSLLTVIVNRWRRLLAVCLLLDAAMLSVAVALVALDAATYRQTHCTGLFSSVPTPGETAHVTYLYALWGLGIALLLVQAVRVLRQPWTRFLGHGQRLAPAPDVIGQPDDVPKT